MPYYETAGPTLSVETDFTEKGEAMLRAAGQTTRIFDRHMAALEAELGPIVVPIFQSFTPVGPDAWHHAGGSLRDSTQMSISKGDQGMSEMPEVTGTLKGVTEQFVLEIEQPAENPYGVAYMPFVVEGHRTKKAPRAEPGRYAALRDAIRHSEDFVEANPYPEHAMTVILPVVNERLAVRGRAIATESVEYIKYSVGS